MKFKVGDTVSHGGVFGTVVTYGEYGKDAALVEQRVAVQWDHNTYTKEYPYSIPFSDILRKVTKLEKALK